METFQLCKGLISSGFYGLGSWGGSCHQRFLRDVLIYVCEHLHGIADHACVRETSFLFNLSFPMSFSVILLQYNKTEMLQGFSFGKGRVWDGQIDL